MSAGTRKPIRIAGPDDVEAVVGGEYGPASIEVAVETFTEAENDRWSRRLTEHYGACGCTAGAVTMLVGLVVVAGYLAAQLLAGQGIDAAVSAGGLVAVGVLGTVSKLLARRVSRYRFRSAARDLEAAIELERGRTDVGRCG